MEKKHRRILWLLNHNTLREFEVPLLRSLGYEVYTSKLCIYHKSFRSGSIDYQHDDSLTIPIEELKRLNEFNFYLNEIPVDIKKIINKYFETAIITASPELFSNMIANFHGRILIRAFGIIEKISYSGVFCESLGNQFDAIMKKMKDKVWLAPAYESIVEIEPPYMKELSVYLPLGVPPSIFANKDTWKGHVNKIFFICPSIHYLPYYEKIYKQFKRNFGKMPHLIGGTQPSPVNDPTILGTVSRNEFDEHLRNCRVMFYHSEEPRHLHYHPLEAMIFGMPVVFMSKGILGTIDDPKNQPGACCTIREAKNKIKRILKGDADLIKSIQTAQQKLIEPFKEPFIKKIWQSNFVEKVMKTSLKVDKLNDNTIKRIAVFLPLNYQGGTLNAAKSIAKMLKIGSCEKNSPVEVVFSCMSNTYSPNEFLDLKEAGVEIRETTWNSITREEVKLIILAGTDSQPQENYFKPLQNAQYWLPCDGMVNFSDCDFWLIISDRTPVPIAPIKPYGMVIYDYIQRYEKNIGNEHYNYNYMENARSAKFVLTTTPQTREDCIQYAGVSAHKVHLTPIFFDPFYKEKEMIPVLKNGYFIWTTNTATHKNHQNALEALCYYYENLQGELNIIMTGTNTENFDLDKTPSIDHPYIHSIRSLLEKYENVFKKRLKIMGNLSQDNYTSILAAAKFLWHPATIDNGTFSVVEAAYYGTPSLSSSYPQMQYINNYFKLNLKFSPSDNPKGMAKNLKEMELNYLHQTDLLPTRKLLEQFSYRSLAGNFYETIEKLL